MISVLRNILIPVLFLFCSASILARQTVLVRHIDAIPCNEVRGAIVDDDGFVWVGTRLGLVRYDGYNVLVFRNDTQHPDYFLSCDIRSICYQGKEHIWLGTFNGICKFNIRTFKTKTYLLPGNNFINQIACMNGNDVFVRNYDRAFKYDKKTDCFVATKSILHTDTIPSDISQLLSGKGIVSTTRDRKGNVWASSETLGLFFIRYDGIRTEMLQHEFNKNLMPITCHFDINTTDALLRIPNIKTINSFIQMPNGALLTGTANNGMLINGSSNDDAINRNISSWLKNDGVYGMDHYDSSHILVGAWNGLFLMNSDGFAHQISRLGKVSLEGVHFLCVRIVSAQDIWLGTTNGVIHVTGNIMKPEKAKVATYNKVGAYSVGGVFSILEDKYKHIWVASSEPSLMLFDSHGDSLKSVSQEFHVKGDNVHDIAMSKNGDLWMTTNYGLLKATTNKDGKIVSSYLYSKKDGLPENYLGSSSVANLPDGRILVIGQWGNCLITPETYKKIPSSKVLITDTLYADKKQIELPYNYNDLTIHLSRLIYGKEHAISYKYKLEGADYHYRETEAGVNAISFPNLPPGDYTFLYEGGELRIRVLQPWWWSWWAKTFYFLFVLLIIGSTAYFLFNRYKQNARMQSLMREKSFLASVSRNFMSPLGIILELIEELKAKATPDSQGAIIMLSTQAKRLQELISDTLQAKTQEREDAMKKEVREMTDLDKDLIRRCRESVNRHISDPEYSHKIMMEEVGASHSTLYRKLKNLTGMDTTSFIREIRIRTACQILEANPNIRISELASKVGYENPRYFTANFKNITGMTPQQYKKQ